MDGGPFPRRQYPSMAARDHCQGWQGFANGAPRTTIAGTVRTRGIVMKRIAQLLTVYLVCGVAAFAADTTPAAKQTFLVIYRPGPAWPTGKPVSQLPLKEHGNYMLSLFKQGRMKQAGPLTDDAGGAVVLEVSDQAEAEAIVAADPAVKSGLFTREMHPWAPVQWEKFRPR